MRFDKCRWLPTFECATARLAVFSLVGSAALACTGALGDDAGGLGEGAGQGDEGNSGDSAEAMSSGENSGTDNSETDPNTSGDMTDNSAPGEQGGSGTTPSPATTPTSFSCDDSAIVATPPMRRLTRQQYDNTIQDALTYALGDADAAGALYQSVLAGVQLPEDNRPDVDQDLHGTFRRLDQTVAQDHVDAWYNIGLALGKELVAPERVEQVVGTCATDGSDASACLSNYLDGFGSRLSRKQLSDDDKAFYADTYDAATQQGLNGYEAVTANLLNSPQVLYIVEHGDGSDGTTSALGPFELASRLSYHFWNSMPDDELWNAAQDGSLLDDDTYQAQVERLFSDPRARQSLRDFFREWLKLENLPDLQVANQFPIFEAFAGDNLPSANLTHDMIEEVVDLVDYFSWDAESDFQQLFSSNLVFPKTDELANIYGVEAGEEPTSIDGRPGLLTRAAFLSSGKETTRPVMKGVFIRETILCDKLPAPPSNIGNVGDPTGDLSTRQVIEQLTQAEGSACAGCHSVLINPLGFATEDFDALGRMRDAEQLFEDDGTPGKSVPIDTSVVPQVVLGDETSVDGPDGLMGLIRDSGKLEACFARHYFRYSFGRWEDINADGCVLEGLRTSLGESQSFSGMLRSVALRPEFKQRSFD